MRTFVSDEPDPPTPSAALLQPLSPSGAGSSSERSAPQPSLFVPPLGPDVLDRPRIHSLIDSAAAPGRLAMLLGPPGTGKTTAAALWARRCERPVVWLDAEESAGDPWEFYADLIDELQRATGTTGLSSIIAYFEQPRPLRRMGAVLARELLRRGTDAAIVVDHAELLGDEALELVEVLAARLSSLSWVLLAVSLDSDFILTAETKLSGGVIDSEDLELTAEEALSVLREA
ncbi:AAA family ATPase [Nesterenkonia pannonica]|uniref:AAA family ATPase n=1 Tax=Nesterenkonia pannonica TaxID=1548602 RepID=UPI002164602E|nr:AAA family ATPase [Nesterenkonia pannonica]